jgi:hypothetical protein
MHIPRRGGRNWRCVKGDINLWKVIPFSLNLRRVFSGLRTMFFKGTFPEHQLLRFKKEKEKETNGHGDQRTRRKRLRRWRRVK